MFLAGNFSSIPGRRTKKRGWHHRYPGCTEITIHFLLRLKLAVMPLVKKDGLPDIAEKIVHDLKFDFNCQYDDKDSIGRRYRRQDAIGTPYCITIDHQTLEDNTVTIRYRDTMLQERVQIKQLVDIIKEKVSIQSLLKKL